MWFKLSEGLLKSPTNVYIADVYNTLKNSSYTKYSERNIIDTLRDKLSMFSPKNVIFISGDFNSRIGTQNQFTIENERDLNYLPRDYKLDTIKLVGNNQDTLVNQYGQQLLDLYIKTKLRTLHIRTCGDVQGHLRYVDFHGFSRVDLVLASEAFLTK